MYDRLTNLAWWFAHRYKNQAPGRLVRLSVEDIHQELMYEVVKVVAAYSYLGEDEVLLIAKRSMRNRMNELLSMEYGTHRRDAQLAQLVDGESQYIDEKQQQGRDWRELEKHHDLSNERLALMGEISRLSPLAKAAAELVINGGDRLTFELLLADLRRSFVFKGGRWKLTVKPYMLARALGVTTSQVEEVYNEIREMLRSL